MRTITGNVLERIDGLRAALASLLMDDLMNMPAAEQLTCLQALRPAVCQMQALQLQLIGVVDANASARSQGSASTATWLRNTLHVPKATDLVKSAAAVSRMPAVAAAFAAGEINDAHVATIAKVAGTMPPRVLVDGVEELLVRQATQLPPSKFGPVATRIRDQSTPGSAPPPDRSTAARWLRTNRRSDGSLSLRGGLDPDGGRIVLAALDSWTAAAGTSGLPDATRYADALVEMCRRTAVPANEDPLEADPVVPDAPRSGPLEPSYHAQRAASQPANGRRRSSVPARDATGRGQAAADRPDPGSGSAVGETPGAANGADAGLVTGTGKPPGGARRLGKAHKPSGSRRRKRQGSPNRT